MSQLPTIKRTESRKELVPIEVPKKVEAKEPQTTTALVEVPMLENLFEGYFSDRINMKLNYVQKTKLKATLYGLQSQFAKLKNGKEVSNGADALKWILENLTS